MSDVLLNSNIEIHKLCFILMQILAIKFLNSNIEIHKLNNFATFDFSSNFFKF